MDFADLITLLQQPFIWALDGMVYVIGYTVYYIMDGFFTCIYGIFSALDLSQMAFDFVGQISGLPSPLLFLLDAVAFPQALAIISGAYLIRFMLNLIPGAITRI